MDIRFNYDRSLDWHAGDILIIQDTEAEIYYYLCLKDDELVDLENLIILNYSNWEETFEDSQLLQVIPSDEIIITRK